MKNSKSFTLLTKENIDDLFDLLNNQLLELNETEILFVVGGVVMCELGCRESTRDVDAYYKNKDLVELATRRIVKRLGKEYDLINDDVVPFLSTKGSYNVHRELSNLTVMYATNEYLFALKCKSCRTDSNDVKDLIFLVEQLQINDQRFAESIISKYFDLDSISILYKDILEDIWNGSAIYYL